MYVFQNPRLANIWRIHPSHRKSIEFQRLEFFGDKILAFVISSYLMQNKQLNEGDLSVRLAALVNKETVSSRGVFLKPYIICSGKLTQSMLCDITEAYLAAVYLDGGDVFAIIKEMWANILNKPFKPSNKNALQEILQKYTLTPIYTYTKNEQNMFICVINVEGMIEQDTYTASGIGVSKKAASAKAAQSFLSKYSFLN